MYGESVMREITTFGNLKGRLQAGFENDEESLEEFGKTYPTRLKAYLTESNQRISGAGCPMLKPYQLIRLATRQSTNVAKQTMVKCGCVRKRYE